MSGEKGVAEKEAGMIDLELLMMCGLIDGCANGLLHH
jgi:hypothetical protein